MNPGGVVEETGKVATTLIGTMKEQPYLLASMLLNFSMVGLLAYAGMAMHDTRIREVGLIYDNAKQIQELLSKCVIPSPGQPE